MKNVIIRTYKELQLYSRFLARNMGLPGYQIHQLCLPEHKLIYIPIPKNACTSIKQAFHMIEFGRTFDTNLPVNDPYVDIHDYYKKHSGAFTSLNKLKSQSEFTRFAIVRDPVERLISCYRNRVVDQGDLQADLSALKKMKLSAEPDLSTFVVNLKEYQMASKSIEHHSRPQSAFLGGSIKYLDHIFPIERMDDLHEMLRKISPDLKMLNRKSRGTKVEFSELTPNGLEAAIRFYKIDYELLNRFYQPKITP
ncbi:MAG: sulfotransferase family 2 domain-containing protein [Balneolaceae bacterium]